MREPLKHEKEAWQALLDDRISYICQQLPEQTKKYRQYNVTPKDSRALIGAARQQAALLLDLANIAQAAADRLVELDKEVS